MVPEPQGKVEKAQENHERFSQPRCPPPLSLTTPFRIYGRQLLFLRARGRHEVVHVPDGITRAALGTFPIQAASTRTVPVTTQRSGGCSSHGRHESDSKLPIQLQPFRRWKWHHSGYVDRSMAGRQFLNSHPEESQELIPEGTFPLNAQKATLSLSFIFFVNHK
ncbi:hypothetical protein TNCT_6321 [Trichonephila clavata]|uniref:Uncharacterized protein n=1 Tax=Trichonephila clavata TaxID=2740835 RepID=A0A8X6H759_TRICU|nr:hypothetical protein TNCT_6321 [Trichonephila clavata]